MTWCNLVLLSLVLLSLVLVAHALTLRRRAYVEGVRRDGVVVRARGPCALRRVERGRCTVGATPPTDPL